MASEASPPQTDLRPFRIRVYKQGSVEADPIAVEISLSSTVRDLKEKVKNATSDAPGAQRLIYQGKQLEDNTILREAFQNILDNPDPITLHAVIRPPDDASAPSPPVRGFNHSPSTSSSSSRQASSSTINPRTSAGTPRGHATPTRRLHTNTPQPQGGPAPINPGGSLNEEVTITTTSGSFFPNSHNFDNRTLQPSGASFFRNQASPEGRSGSASTSRNTQTPSESTDNPQNPNNPTNTAPFAGPRNNTVYQRIVHTQTRTLRIGHPPHASASSEPPTTTSYTTSYSVGPSGTSFQGASMQPSTSGPSTAPSLRAPSTSLRRARSEPLGDDAPSTSATSTAPNLTRPPGLGEPNLGNTIPNNLNAHFSYGDYDPTGPSTQSVPDPSQIPQGPFATAYPEFPGVEAYFGLPSFEPNLGSYTPQEQFWLLQSPDGPTSLLLSPTPPTAPSLPRRTPLGPVHLSPPPGWSLNEPLLDPPATQPPGGDFLAREAALQQQIEQARAANMHRIATLNEQRRHLNELMEQLQNATWAQPQATVEELQENRLRRQMQVQQQLIQQLQVEERHPRPQPQPQPALERLRRNPIDFVLDNLLRFFRGNPHPPQPEARGDQRPDQRRERERANLFLDNLWLIVRLGFALFLLGGGTDVRRDFFLWVAVIVIFDPARQAVRPQPQPQPQAQDGELQPHDLAQRLIDQHQARQERAGGMLETIQNGVSIFLASLVPGLGERIGAARERERERERRLIEEAQQAQEGQPAADGEGADVQGLPAVEGQAPGPQDPNVVNAAQEHFGDARAEELFGPQQPAEGQAPGQQQADGGPVDALFGAL
ncbi:hypothetical protein ABW21_db0209152 [Orbilia brochopaga]|nr:hypothetical protein ABW21_db0209152 [Drechslerella brochopaga]